MSTAEQLKSEDAPPSRRGPVPFGNYLLDDLIAVGGMARVYRARLRGALGFEKPLVVKQVRPELAKDPRFVAMFAQEAKTLVRLTHPHIVTVYELGVVDETYFIAMEYIEGVTLQALLENSPLRPEFAAHIASQVCDALHHAHERFDLVHRDVTPRNILIDEEGQTRLVDFGIAVPRDDMLGDEGGDAGEGGFGSVGYMSPEQLRGATLGPRSDVFSLGCSIHHSLFGEVPFDTDGTSLTRTSPNDPEHPFASHVESMISLSPAKRPNAREAGRVFRTWLSGSHPEGVAQELGALVSEVREVRESLAQLSAVDPDKPEAGQTSTTRSIATSPLLPSSGEILDAEAAESQSSENPHAESPGTVPLPGRGGRDVVAPSEEARRKGGARRNDAPEDEAPEDEAPAPRKGPGLRAMVVLLPILLIFGGIGVGVLQRAGLRTSSTSVGEASEENDGEIEPQPDTPEAVDTEDEAPPEPAVEVSPMNIAPTDTMSAPMNVSPMNTVAMRQVEPVVSNAVVIFASTPWAEVYIDGERVGVTPLRERLPRGRHTIRLVNPALGSELTRTLNLEGGETLRLRADFNSTPPAFR